MRRHYERKHPGLNVKPLTRPRPRPRVKMSDQTPRYSKAKKYGNMCRRIMSDYDKAVHHFEKMEYRVRQINEDC